MDCLNSKTKCVIYHRTKNQHLHACEKLKIQNGGQYGRQKLKYVYLSSKVSYKEKWGVDLDKFNVMELIHRSGNSLEM